MLIDSKPIFAMSSNHPVSNGGTPRLGMKQRASATEALEYKTALQVFDEETMKRACSLLLSEADYQEGGNPNGSDYDKLLAIFTRCNEAAKIVERHAVSKPSEFPSLAAPPPTFAQTPRAAAKKAVMHPPVPRRVSLAQMARAGRMKRPALTRETSDSSAASSASTNSASKHKKQRTSHQQQQQQPNNDGEASAPPQEALDFLQALNNQGSKKSSKPKASTQPFSSSRTESEAPDISSSGRSHGLSHPRAARAKAESSQKKKLRHASSLESLR